MIANGFDMGLSVYGVLEGEKMDKLEYALYRAKGIGKQIVQNGMRGFILCRQISLMGKV